MKWSNAGARLQETLDSFVGRKDISFSRILKGLLFGVVLLAFVGDVKGVVDARNDAKLAEERSKIVLQVNSITLARFAKYRADKDSLSNALAAAEAMNGTLVAALAIRTKPDTVYVPTNPTDTRFDTTAIGVTRTASLSDTTDMGISIDIEAKAPPEPAALELGYKLVVPEFRPEIAFIETDEGVFASVSWANQKFQVEAPFYEPRTDNPKPLRINVGATGLVHNTAGLSDIFYGAAFLEVEFRTDSKLSIGIPLGIDFNGPYTGVTVRKTLGEWDGLLDLVNPFN